jgi:glycosyltransferase involved in cell wall biosynthesis
MRYTIFVGEGRPAPDGRLRVRASRLPTSHPAVRVVWEQILQPGQLWQVRADLHHAMAFVAPVIAPCPSVVTVYDLSFLRYPELFRPANRLYLRLMTGFSCRRARRAIAISESTARDVQNLLGVSAGRIDVAVPGVDGRFFAPVSAERIARFREASRLPERFFLFLGTLEPRKNLVTLLQAYAALPASAVRAVKLVLAGGRGWMYEEVFRSIEALGLGGDVLVSGYVPDEDLPLWYRAAEAFVYPSIYEGFGMPLLEAMASGVPVIAADSSSLPEAVGETGRLVPATDVSAWAAVLSRAIESPGWREGAGARGQARARTFTWARTAAQTVAAYRRALEAA